METVFQKVTRKATKIVHLAKKNIAYTCIISRSDTRDGSNIK